MKPRALLTRRFNTFRKTGVAMLLVAGMAVPAPAFALQSLLEIASTKLAEYVQVLTKQAALLAQWTYDKTENLLATQSSTESIVASIEKELLGNKELTQAQANYEAANASRLRFESAQDNFLAPSAKPFKTCETLSEGASISSAGNDTKEMVKSSTQAAVQRGLHTENASAAARQVLTEYKSRYCSDEDVRRGFCQNAAPVLMQGASLRASSLLMPAAGESYTPEEAIAAADYITMITNPVPDEMLVKGTEKKKGASQAFNLALMNAQAQMSMATFSLHQILASRAPESAIGRGVGGESEGSISKVGLMKRFAEKRFSDPAFNESMNKMGESALLQEFTLQMAARNWMDFQSYEQDERIEALIATRLAVLASERNARQLQLARSMSKGP